MSRVWPSLNEIDSTQLDQMAVSFDYIRRSVTHVGAALYWLWDAPDEPRRPRTVIEHPQIRQLVADWGRPEDFGLLAMDAQSEKVAGGIWTRLDGWDGMPGYGCDYPALGIAVLEGYQGRGLGQMLMQ